MELRRLGNSDLRVSPVSLGSWAMGNDYWGPVDDRDSVDTIREALDNGVNLIDTAPSYGAGHSEEVVGKGIKGRRNSVIVATKCGILRDGPRYIHDLSPQSLVTQVEDSLRRLDIDCIDLFQIHWPDPGTPLEKTMEALVKIRDQGKFRWFGVSNFRPKQMDVVRQFMDVISLQPQYSLLMRTPESKLIPYCEENNIGILSYGTLGAGILTGKFNEIPTFEEGDIRNEFYHYFKEPVWSMTGQILDVLREIADDRDVPVSQVVINWTYLQPGITSVLVGAKNTAQARSNAQAMSWQLTGEEIQRIERAFKRIFRGEA